MPSVRSQKTAVEGAEAPNYDAGPALYEKLCPQLEGLPPGSYVVIALETGEFVTGPSLSAADELFEKRYGNIPGYVRRIGRLTRI